MNKSILIIIGLALIMISIEVIFERSNWPKIKNWIPRALIFNIIHLVITVSFSYVFDDLFNSYKLYTITGGLFTETICGYLVITFIYYWWHRARHKSNFLWRTTHQLHHSPSRLEIITSFYKHPIEIVINSLIISLILNLLLGISYEGQSIILLIMAIAELFYHWNIRTPYWLGFIIQRPESHCVHHQYNLHDYNYSDLPIWDIIFGTFYNPKSSEFTCGYKIGYEDKIIDMLLCKDIHRGKA